ncbi:ABC transporter permease [Paenochrobactrum sp. BZR 588]|uniref:ABC transporter permease n=1 Tax=Paenochrobactrum TaxID=999488 RepID=UPI0035BBBA95
MAGNARKIALNDITHALKKIDLAALLGWHDVKQRYMRSALGPFWLTLSMAIMIGAIGIVFSQLFQTPLKEFLPFLTIGIILWSFMLTSLSEACTSFIMADGIVKQLPIPLFTHIIRSLWRNMIIFAHNIIIAPFVFLIVGASWHWNALLAIPGFILVCINLAWVMLILAVVCTRYRDLIQIVASILQVLFYISPVMWMPQRLPDHIAKYLLTPNPVYHLLEIVRAPLLGQLPNSLNWITAIVMAMAGWSVAIVFYGKFRYRIAYWL